MIRKVLGQNGMILHGSYIYICVVVPHSMTGRYILTSMRMLSGRARDIHFFIIQLYGSAACSDPMKLKQPVGMGLYYLSRFNIVSSLRGTNMNIFERNMITILMIGYLVKFPSCYFNPYHIY